jgi:hypothetical protein
MQLWQLQPLSDFLPPFQSVAGTGKKKAGGGVGCGVAKSGSDHEMFFCCVTQNHLIVVVAGRGRVGGGDGGGNDDDDEDRQNDAAKAAAMDGKRKKAFHQIVCGGKLLGFGAATVFVGQIENILQISFCLLRIIISLLYNFEHCLIALYRPSSFHFIIAHTSF